MRWLVLLLAGCSFKPHALGVDDARDDAPTTDATDAATDAATDGGGSATPDAWVMATVSFVQGTSGANQSSVAQLTLGQAVADGDLCVVGVAINGNAISNVSDTHGDTFTSVSSGGGLTVYVAANMQAGAGDTVTITFTNNTGYTAAAAVYRGLARMSPVDGTSIASGTGNSLDSGMIQTAHPHDLLVGVAASDGTMFAGSGYTARAGGTYSLIEDEEVTATGGYDATATAGNVNWRMAVVALAADD